MMQVRKLARLWRTVRHLRPVQVYGRLWLRLARPRPDLSPAPTLRKQAGNWQAPARRPASLVGPDRFRFLNEAGSIAEHGWDNPAKTKLWRYNQHYFDDLNAEAAEERLEWHQALIGDWITSNPPGQGSGWEPYPTSLRIVNWVKWALAGNALPDTAIASLAVQTRWLTRRMEWHLLGNHLFANAKALVFAGLFFEGSEADAWLAQALRILEREMAEQILPDGGQFELSPMYHALAVEDMLDLVNIAHAYGRQDLLQAWRPRVPAMLDWLKTMSHPDGRIAFFNDAAFGIAPSNAELMEYGRLLGFENGTSVVPVHHLQDSGYLRMSAGQFMLIADLGRIGPDYLPGHAHADTLSFELSIDGQRIFVNSGTSEYGTSSERQRQRGTAAHNTVVVAGENSSEVWAGFRVGRRARPQNVMVEQQDTILRTQASHDGYRHLPERPVVMRCFEMNEKRLVVTDSVTTGARAEARYHVHPAINISSVTGKDAVLALPSGQRFKIHCDGGALRVEPTTWHPEFGVTIPNCCLVVPLADGRASLSMMSA
jgi:uncharacterized heparinase superfamily protein